MIFSRLLKKHSVNWLFLGGDSVSLLSAERCLKQLMLGIQESSKVPAWFEEPKPGSWMPRPDKPAHETLLNATILIPHHFITHVPPPRATSVL